MAWSQQKNEIFFQRARNWAAAVQNLLEERNRLVDLFENEANGSEFLVDTATATVMELAGLKSVMDSLDAMINNGAVSQEDRVGSLTPFLASET